TGGMIIRELGLTGATDITGFGLGGHMIELAEASHVTLELRMLDVPLLPGALDMASMGLLPAGSICNRRHYLPRVKAADGLDPIHFDMMFDAQTSGGLILAVAPELVDRAMAMLEDAGEPAALVGRALSAGAGDQPLSIV
ncbi:MAG TPA: AIR synthase-related protein, partial [Pseudodesulfovibrio sp.]|nr:AIR synthase-related protein [Pseudodesulfovibrio sp.]